MQVLIFASGPPKPFETEHGLRHLLPIDGEPLLARTVRMLRERECSATVVCPPPLCDCGLQCDFFVPEDDTHLLSTILSARRVWSGEGRTLLLWGDMVWSPWSLDRVLENETSLQFFMGRPAGNVGMAFDPTWQDEIASGINYILELPALSVEAGRDGRRVPGHLQRLMLGFDVLDTTSPRDKPHPYHSTVRSSYTQDVDTWEAYLSILEEMNGQTDTGHPGGGHRQPPETADE